jgi:hypothetical protein
MYGYMYVRVCAAPLDVQGFDTSQALTTDSTNVMIMRSLCIAYLPLVVLSRVWARSKRSLLMVPI